ncbi:MAG TPA: MBL fold metallo-hydrolase [Kiloniellales bacterium]|nr:MBL fold metallo-hydrolase [Kiloniellales bacterium]
MTDVESFFHEPTNSLSHLVSDPATRAAALIDPVLDYDQRGARRSTAFIDKVIDRIRAQGLKLIWILETHVHADHLTAAPEVKAQLGGTICIGRHVTAVQQRLGPLFGLEEHDGRQFDRLLADGERLPLGQLEVRVLETPGHTPACVTYVVGDAAFVGDTLFMPDSGSARCDFPGGDATTLYRSIRKILALPAETRIFVCHDYKAGGARDKFAWETSVAEQNAANIHIKEGVAEADFVALREGRDKTLTLPVLILPAVQYNMRGGHPSVGADGRPYLTLPLDQV